LASWERPYQFLGYKDGKGDYEQDEGVRICIFKDKDGQICVVTLALGLRPRQGLARLRAKKET
jgi:hypothetical protein